DIVHLRPRGTFAAEGDHRLHVFLGSFEDGLDGAVAAIRHGARDATRLGLVARRVAEEDALHIAADDHPPPHAVAHARPARAASARNSYATFAARIAVP